MAKDSDHCEKCGEEVFHKKNSTECFMLQEWKREIAEKNEQLDYKNQVIEVLTKQRDAYESAYNLYKARAFRAEQDVDKLLEIVSKWGNKDRNKGSIEVPLPRLSSKSEKV